MNELNALIRRMMIRAYFEAYRMEDDEWGLDHSVDDAALFRAVEKVAKDEGLVVKSGAYIQCDPNWQPPYGIVFTSSYKGTEVEAQTMVETDEQVNVTQIFSEKM